MAIDKSRLDPIHAGEVLHDDFLVPMNLGAVALADTLRVPVTRVAEIVRGHRAIPADIALRLARYFNTTARFRLNLQISYDLEVASDKIEREVGRR
jgi:antitoxin HigA-1